MLGGLEVAIMVKGLEDRLLASLLVQPDVEVEKVGPSNNLPIFG